MSLEIIELLSHLELEKVVGRGYDFGATLLSRIVTYDPSRFSKTMSLAVGPPRPDAPFKADEINKMTKVMSAAHFWSYVSGDA